MFEGLQRARRGGVRDGFFEFLRKRVEDGRVGEDVVGGYGQHVCGRQGSGADEALRFPDEAREGLLRGRELVVVAQRVEYRRVGLGSNLVVAGEDRSDLDRIFPLQGTELGD